MTETAGPQNRTHESLDDRFVERRAHPRCRALVLFRRRDDERRRCVRDIGAGGLGVLSDERVSRGERFPAELFFPGDSATTLREEVEVVWRRRLPPMAAAKYLLGLAFREPTPEARREISRVTGAR